MACNNNNHKNNVVLLSLGLLLLSSLCQCISLTKNLQENSISLSRTLQWHHGKLLIGLKPEQGGKSKEAKVDLDYQSDMAWEVPGLHQVQEHGFPRSDNTAVERLLKMDPTVDCSGNYMRLQVQNADSKPGALLFVDRGDLSPLSLSKLPKSCGYRVSSTRRDLVMVAPYDGCFVIVEETRYVLPLRWFGLPVQMSCPLGQHLSSSNPPMVTCHAEGMVVKTDWTSRLSEIKVNLNGNWEPLMKASSRCGFGAVEHPEFITISISYRPCMEKKDGLYSLKLLRDNEVRVLCPSLAPTDNPKLMMDVGLDPTPAPTQNVRTTPQVPEYPIPPSPSQIWNQFYPPHWYMQHPEAVQLAVPQPTDDKMVEQPFNPMYPEMPLPDGQNPGSVPLDESMGQSYPMFYPNGPSQTVAEHPSQPDNPSQDVNQLYYPEWYMSEPHPDYPFYYPRDPVNPTASPEPTAPPEQESPVPPVYLYPYYYPTEQKEISTSTASPPAAVPQHYQLFGPYYYPLPSQHQPHTTTTLTQSTQKLQDPPISRPGTVVIFPPNAKPETKPVECSQYCQLGLPNCCPQVAFHHHLHHFVPREQNGKPNPHLHSLSGLPNGFRPYFVNGPSHAPREAPADTPRTNSLTSPQLFPLRPHERQTYNRPLEGNPAAQSEPSERTDNQPAYPNFEPNDNFPYSVDTNPWSHQNPSDTSSGTPLHYSEYFDPLQGTNVYLPYNVQSSQQSDDPPAPNLSRFRHYLRKPAKNVQGPASLAFRSQQDAHEDNLSSHQFADAFRRTAKREETGSHLSESRGYVLLQQGPPGRESSNPVQPQSRKPAVLGSENLGQKKLESFPNEFLNLKEESEDSKRREKETSAGLTFGDQSEPPFQTSSSAGPNSAPLSQEPSGRRKPPIVRFLQRPSSFGYMHRTLQDVPQVEITPERLRPKNEAV